MIKHPQNPPLVTAKNENQFASKPYWIAFSLTTNHIITIYAQKAVDRTFAAPEHKFKTS